MTELLFRPSSAASFLACAHFEPRGEEADSPFLERGHQIHAAIAAAVNAYLDRGLSLESVLELADLPSDVRVSVAFVLNLVCEEFAEIAGIESPVTLGDPVGRFLTRGTIDLWGYGHDGRVKLADWKTGLLYDFAAAAPKDHSAQLKCYAHGLFGTVAETEIDALEVYLDAREVRRYAVSTEDALIHVDDLAWRRRNRSNLPHTIHAHCDWCALRGECPAWAAEAARAVVPAPEPMALDFARLKADPDRLGAFLQAYRRFRVLVEEEHDLEGAAKTLLASGIAVPGFSLRKRSGKASIHGERFLFECAELLGYARAGECLTVSVDKAQKAWAHVFPERPFPCAVIPGEPGVSLHLDPPPKKKPEALRG